MSIKYLTFALAGILVAALALAGGDPATGRAQEADTPSPVPQLYWVDPVAGKIQRTHRHDPTVVEDVIASGLVSPWGLALDVVAGKMYWTDPGAQKIQRANLDGSSVEDLLTSDSGLLDPADLVLDLPRGLIYWADRAIGSIRRASFDGPPWPAHITGTPNPHGIALHLDAGKMYWTERRLGRIRIANLDGTGGRHLPVPDVVNPEHILLDLAAGHIYWTEHHDNQDKIRRADLDGSNPLDLFVSESGSVAGLALDLPAARMYWTDPADNRIRRSNLDGSEIEDVVTSGLADPGAILVAATPQRHPDEAFLEAFYHAAAGPGWTRRDNWLTVAPLDKWHGVTTHPDGSVTQIVLTNNGLTGPIPVELGSLSNLNVLNLGHNGLTGEIPAELGNLTSLVTLGLGLNGAHRRDTRRAGKPHPSHRTGSPA